MLKPNSTNSSSEENTKNTNNGNSQTPNETLKFSSPSSPPPAPLLTAATPLISPSPLQLPPPENHTSSIGISIKILTQSSRSFNILEKFQTPETVYENTEYENIADINALPLTGVSDSHFIDYLPHGL